MTRTTMRCTCCGNDESFIITATVQALVRFTPDGENEIEHIPEDDASWNNASIAECAACGARMPVGVFRHEATVPA